MEKTKNEEASENDYAELYRLLKAFVRKQIKHSKWLDKSAIEAWEHLDFALEYWESCQTKYHLTHKRRYDD